jgi:hypothetical protein
MAPGHQGFAERGRRAKRGRDRMQVPCPKCNEAAELETNWECPECGTTMRRCADCRHYEFRRGTCVVTRTSVDLPQARAPGKYSVSYACKWYEYAEDVVPA